MMNTNVSYVGYNMMFENFCACLIFSDGYIFNKQYLFLIILKNTSQNPNDGNKGMHLYFSLPITFL